MNFRTMTVAALLIAASATFSPLAAQPQGTTSLTFDGFCDGLTVTVSGAFIGGSHTNWDCAGAVTFVNGSVNTVSRVRPAGVRPKSLAVIGDYIGPLAIFCPINYYLDFAANAWSNYTSCDGQPEKLINQGTFTLAPQTMKIGGFPSYRAARPSADDADVAGDSAAPVGPYTVSFDGYCDFMAINTKGNKLGGTHDASGCAVSGTYLLAGNNEKQPAELTGTSGDGSFVYTLAAADCVEVYYFSWSNSTFSIWAACGVEQPFFVNSGTVTVTTSGGTRPPAAGKPASFRR